MCLTTRSYSHMSQASLCAVCMTPSISLPQTAVPSTEKMDHCEVVIHSFFQIRHMRHAVELCVNHDIKVLRRLYRFKGNTDEVTIGGVEGILFLPKLRTFRKYTATVFSGKKVSLCGSAHSAVLANASSARLSHT